MVPCPGCKAKFSSSSPCDHPYIGAAQSCWEVYQKILMKEFSDPAYFKVHRITVDAYAVSHIGDQTDRRARQSAHVHLIALFLLYRENMGLEKIAQFLSLATTPKRDWPPIEQIENPTWLSVKDVVIATSSDSHSKLVKEWGRSVLDNYSHIEQELKKAYHRITE